MIPTIESQSLEKPLFKVWEEVLMSIQRSMNLAATVKIDLEEQKKEIEYENKMNIISAYLMTVVDAIKSGMIPRETAVELYSDFAKRAGFEINPEEDLKFAELETIYNNNVDNY